jgi:acetyl/propionyl-CoA carboxylase alpha subunit
MGFVLDIERDCELQREAEAVIKEEADANGFHANSLSLI